MNLSQVKIALAAMVLLSSGFGCASAYLITSNPSGAAVSYYDQETQKKVVMGSTPLQYSKSSLPKDRAILMSVELEGYLPAEFPMASTDESRTQVNISLKPDTKGLSKFSRELNVLTQKLFKAQSLIYEKKYHAAILLLDEVLKERSELVVAQVMKGTAFFLLNELPSAVSAWKIALKIEPENPELNRFLSERNIKIPRP